MDDFTQPETFGVPNASRKALKSLLSPVLLFVLVIFLLGWFIINGLIMGTFMMVPRSTQRLVTSGAISGGVTVLAILIWFALQVFGLKRATITASPVGVVMTAGGIIREVAWGDFTHTGRVKPLRGVDLGRGGSSAQLGNAAAAAINRTAQELSGSPGLFGRGSVSVEPGNGVAATQLQQNAGIWGHDTAGFDLVGIAPAEIDDDWFAGRLGDWLRHYRPDLASELTRP